MIIVERKIEDIVGQIPYISMRTDLSRKASFHWGDKKELNRYLELTKDNNYPLIWLLPGADKYNQNGTATRDCVFIIATRETNVDLFNPARYDKSYHLVLNPLTEYLVEGLRTSSISQIVKDEWEVQRFPNYSESEHRDENDNVTIDLWDAIKLSCSVQFNNNCLNIIKWQI